MDALEAMKAELSRMREEEMFMKARLRAAESEVQEKKRVISEYKAMEKLADVLLDVVIELAGGNNVDENNDQNLDEETMKGFIEEAMRDFTEALNKAQSGGSRPADGGNGSNKGGNDGGRSE